VLRRDSPPAGARSGRGEDSGFLPPVLQGSTDRPLVVPEAPDEFVAFGEDFDERAVHPT
jgi:hypothetical protein